MMSPGSSTPRNPLRHLTHLTHLSAILLVLGTLGIDRNVFSKAREQQAVAAAWILLVLVDGLWLAVFGADRGGKVWVAVERMGDVDLGMGEAWRIAEEARINSANADGGRKERRGSASGVGVKMGQLTAVALYACQCSLCSFCMLGLTDHRGNRYGGPRGSK